jgi:hypothetical protein
MDGFDHLAVRCVGPLATREYHLDTAGRRISCENFEGTVGLLDQLTVRGADLWSRGVLRAEIKLSATWRATPGSTRRKVMSVRLSMGRPSSGILFGPLAVAPSGATAYSANPVD